MAVSNDPLKLVYNRWERFLNSVSDKLGGHRELDELSEKMSEVKAKAFADGVLTMQEREEIASRMELIAKAYEAVLNKHGFSLDKKLPTTKEAFKLLGENQEIHFQYLAGKDLRSGVLGDLAEAAQSGDKSGLKAAAKKISFDILTSKDPSIAEDKVKLLRAVLSRVPDRAAQLGAISEVRGALEKELSGWLVSGGKLAPISVADFDAASTFNTKVSVQKTPLPASVKGTNKMFPNKPLGAEWEATTRAAVAAGFDDLSKGGQFFIDRIPNDGKLKTVALKLDMNLGADGPPSVTDPASTRATVLELLERADKKDKKITLTVGDSSGGENIPIGRLSMDILRDTGAYHMALKGGLEFAASKGDAGAVSALALIQDAESRGVYLGSKDDKKTNAAQRAQIEAAASKYVKVVDYDAEGYKSIDPNLGPMGLAAWGTREFQIAKPWVEADYRVHVTRGLSNHMLAKWTGSLKGLIGLHAFGLRPVDQSMEKRGQSALDFFQFLSSGSLFAVFQKRTGLTDVLAKIKASDDPEIKQAWEAVEAKFDNVRGNVAASKIFTEGTKKLNEELRQDKANGASEVDIANKMRWKTREILERAEKEGNAPGYAQGLWDAVHGATRVALRLGWSMRGVLPEESRDDRVGQRIGLLTALPHQSDLVVQTQPKIGLEGGPDAYRNVRDVGLITVGTNEAALDAVAWERAGLKEHMWGDNWPLYFAQQYGKAPMHRDEITQL